MRGTKKIDLEFRPQNYFLLAGLERLLSKIKGVKRREMVRNLLKSSRLKEIPEVFAKASLSEEERQALGRIHPLWMGGEYLPDTEEQEVEIARISITSTTGDVTSVYARCEGGKSHFRVVDEYDGETLSGPAECSSDETLTLGELVDFFDEAWPLMPVLKMNFDTDLDAMLRFFKVESAFYPEIDTLYQQRVREAFSDQHT